MSLATKPKLDSRRLQIAYDRLKEGVESGDLPVGLLAVASADGLIRCEGYGPGGPISTDGIYLLASITKPILATAVMQLVEAGKVLLDDSVVKYIPEFGQNHKETVKVWHLLTHTSGLDSGYMDTPPPPARNADLAQPPSLPTAADDLAGVCQTFLRFKPGTRFEYCNCAFRVLGEIIRRQSGLDYPEYLAKNVFELTGMVDTSFKPGASQSARVLPVVDFPPMPGGIDFFVSLATPAGGLFSTAADLVAFGQAYLRGGLGQNGRLLGPATIAAMTRLQTQGIFEHSTDSPQPVHWGLGFAKTSPGPRLLLSPAAFGHGGATGTHLLIDPENNLVMVYLTNRWDLSSAVKDRVLNAVMASLE